jgi:hypothetical protein
MDRGCESMAQTGAEPCVEYLSVAGVCRLSPTVAAASTAITAIIE